MRIIDDTFIIGIDSGYGNIKTANCCFPASVAAYDTEPVFKDNMLVYGNRFYLIGEGHKEFLADKTRDNDYRSEEHTSELQSHHWYQEQIDRFMKQFENPERLIRLNGTLMSVPYKPEPDLSR